MSNSNFDVSGFYAALDGVRQARGMNWKQVAAKSGVAASTLTRMGQGKRPDVDGLAALAMWSSLDVANFYNNRELHKNEPEALGEITALLRADKNLSGEGAVALENMLKAAYEQIRKR